MSRKEEEVSLKDIINQKLREIETKSKDIPFVDEDTAVLLMGKMNAANSTSTVIDAHQKHRLFVFSFGKTDCIYIPKFQFKTNGTGVMPVVPTLCEILSGLNDWGVFDWLTSYSADLECTPADAIHNEELIDDLVYLAGLFSSESRLCHLSYKA